MLLTLVSAFSIAIFSVIITANILQSMASTDESGTTELPSPLAALSILFVVVACNVMLFTLLVRGIRRVAARARGGAPGSNPNPNRPRPAPMAAVSQWLSRFNVSRNQADRMGAYAPLNNESQHGFIASTGTEMVFVSTPPAPATAPAYAPEQSMGYVPPAAPVFHGQSVYSPVSAMPVSSVNMF